MLNGEAEILGEDTSSSQESWEVSGIENPADIPPRKKHCANEELIVKTSEILQETELNDSVDDSSDPSSVSQNTEDTDSIENNLLIFLQSSSDGKVILAHYKVHNCLNKKTRNLLTRIIIKHFKEEALKNVEVGSRLDKFYISSKTFKSIAKAISVIFHGEVASVYYSPYRFENGKKCPVSGSLWSNYAYTKDCLRKELLLAPPITSTIEESLEVTQVRNSALSDEEVKTALLRLESSLEKDTILSDWKATYSIRKILLSVDKILIDDYIAKFPCLRVSDALKLYDIDFDILYPNKRDFLTNRWPAVKSVLITQIEALDKNKKKDIEVATSIALLPTLKSENQDALILYLLHLLIGHDRSAIKRKKGEPSEPKITPAETRDTFLLRVEKTEDLDNEITKLKQILLKRHSTLQPFMAIVGKLIQPEEFFVIVNEEKYKAESCLQALDATFKIFFALDCAYPKASSKLWQFIQIAIYDITVNSETVIKSVKELVGLTQRSLLQGELQVDAAS